MDWDELVPSKPSSPHQIGEPLEARAICELEALIKVLEDEINRIKAELLKKQRHSASAKALFKN